MAGGEKVRPKTRQRWGRVAAKAALTSGDPLDPGKLRGNDPDLALPERRALMAAHWTLLEHWENDGKHFVLVQRNDAAVFGFETLTPRERQALGLVARGLSNKCVAYEMGIAASTVSVLLLRAARKLGTSSRAELIETFLRLDSLTR